MIHSHHIFNLIIFHCVFDRQFLHDVVEIAPFILLLIHCLVVPFQVSYPHHSKLRKLQKLLITSELCCKDTRDPLCHFKMAPWHMCKELGPETNYQATR